MVNYHLNVLFSWILYLLWCFPYDLVFIPPYPSENAPFPNVFLKDGYYHVSPFDFNLYLWQLLSNFLTWWPFFSFRMLWIYCWSLSSPLIISCSPTFWQKDSVKDITIDFEQDAFSHSFSFKIWQLWASCRNFSLPSGFCRLHRIVLVLNCASLLANTPRGKGSSSALMKRTFMYSALKWWCVYDICAINLKIFGAPLCWWTIKKTKLKSGR